MPFFSSLAATSNTVCTGYDVTQKPSHAGYPECAEANGVQQSMMDVPSQFLAARTLDSRINANLCQICSTLRLQRSPLRLHQASSPSQMAMCLPMSVYV